MKPRKLGDIIRTQALAVYLFWLKTGLSQDIIATHFDKIDRNDVKKFLHTNQKRSNRKHGS